MALDPARTVAELRELARLTGDAGGAQRVCWTETWAAARAWMREKLSALPVEVEVDAAGNQWATLAGASERCVVIGGHIDSVPNGGWLDGSLNVLGGLEVLRRLARDGTPPVTVRLVDWADEEGARFGRSLFGSSAAAGSMRDQDDLRRLVDADGVSLPEALAAHGVELDRALEARAQLDGAAAYLELHIEQGPVLEAHGIDFGVVTAIVGIARIEIELAGEAAHAGTTTMALRRDAAAAGAEAIVWVRERARALAVLGEGHFVATVGVAEVLPGAANVVPRTMRIVVDARSERRALMDPFVRELKTEVERIAARERVTVARFAVVSDSEPAACDAGLRAVLDASVKRRGHSAIAMASGAGHDAAFLARVAPMAMLFVPCRGGRSHCPEEWAEPAALAAGAEVLLDAVRRIDAGGTAA